GAAALERRRLEAVGGAAPGRSGAELRRVARAGRRAAERRRRLEPAARRAAVAVDDVSVVAVFTRIDDAVAAARAGDRRVDDVHDRRRDLAVGAADAAFRAAERADHLGVAVEEGGVGEAVAARRRVVLRRPHRAEDAVDGRVLQAGRNEVEVGEVVDPALDAVVGLPGRRLGRRRLLTGVGHEDDGETRVGAEEALAARHGGATRPSDEPVERDARTVEAALLGVAAGAGLDVGALTRT